MNIFNHIASLAVVALVTTVSAKDARSTGLEFDINASAGYQYDSNVNLAETDENTGEADSALLLTAGAIASLPITSSLLFGVGYDYSQTNYQEFSEFDLAMHHGLAELSLGLMGFDTSLMFDLFNARLDREQFLEITQVSPSVARLFGDSIYLRGAFMRSQKNYAGGSSRDASSDAFRADAYILFDGMKRYLSIGYLVLDENASDEELDFDASRSMLAYGHQIEIGRQIVALKSSLQLESRDYSNVTESIGSLRRDKRLRAAFAAEIPATEYFGITAEIAYVDNQSNLPSADFDESVFTLNLSLEF